MYDSILVALDGSPDSLEAGRLALAVAQGCGARLLATHVYDLAIHEERFEQMEPGLPETYQDEGSLEELRQSHDMLMTEGFRALSRGYMQAYVKSVREAGVEVEELVVKGRNYVKLIETAREREVGMVALGARGLGDVGDGVLGSVATRVLHATDCDILIARHCEGEPGTALVVGIDGSDAALAALDTSCGWAGWLATGVEIVAAYDTTLHQQVFRTMSEAMSPEDQLAAGLEKQESLHESLIDDGLALLYRDFLDQADRRARAKAPNGQVRTHLVAAKAYRGVLEKGEELGATLAVVGRFGHHREAISAIGSNAERVVHRFSGSVLVTACPPSVEPNATTESVESGESSGLTWTPEALERLGVVPGFARAMAKRAVESQVLARGEASVTVEAFEMVSKKMGMGRPK